MPAPERAPAVRALRLAVFASLLIATLRLGLNLVPEVMSTRAAGRVDTVFDLGAVLAVAAIVYATYRLRRADQGASARLLSLALALALGAVELGILLVLWGTAIVGGSDWHLAELALVALLCWAGARSALFMGMFGLAARDGLSLAAPLAALVPLAAGARVLLFIGTLLSPYLEAGGDTRRIFLSTAQLRGWLAFLALLLVEGAIAWLAGRIARTS